MGLCARPVRPSTGLLRHRYRYLECESLLWCAVQRDLVITLLYDIFLHDDKVGALRDRRTGKYTYALAWLYMA